MLKYILLTFSILFTNSCFAQQKLQKIINEELDLVSISGSLYANRFEVSVRDYREFLFYLKEDSSKLLTDFTKIYEDKLNWKLADSGALYIPSFAHIKKKTTLQELLYSKRNRNRNHNYFELFGFIGSYPIIGITHEQAKLYCQWKSKTVTQNVNNWLKKEGFSQRYSFKYRLPTRKEWMFAFGKSQSYNQKINYSKNVSKVLQKMGFKKNKNQTYYDLTIDQKLPSNQYNSLYEQNTNFVGSTYYHPPNQLGLYNMKGNVAEMIDEVGVAMGGSWRSTLAEIDSSISQNYVCPSEWLGFRVFCEIKEIESDEKIVLEEYKINNNSACEDVYQRNDLNNPKYNEPKYQAHAMDSLYKLTKYDSLEISELDDKFVSKVGDKIRLDFEQCYDTIYLAFTEYRSRFYTRRRDMSLSFVNTNLVTFSKSRFKNTLFGIFIILYLDDKKTTKYVVIDDRTKK